MVSWLRHFHLRSNYRALFTDCEGHVPKTILVVEDHDDIRATIKMILEVMGCRVMEATDGAAAVELARRERPHLILMNLNLPVLDGFQATKQIREQGETLQIPVVAMSAHCWDFDWHEKAKRVGCQDCLKKPVDFDALDKLLIKIYC